MNGSIERIFYPLYENEDKQIFHILKKQIGKNIIANYNQEEINSFVKFLLGSQKMKDWRVGIRECAWMLKNNSRIDIEKFLEKMSKISISEGDKFPWVVYKEDKEICEKIDEILHLPINFVGSPITLSEFIIRFSLSQFLYDWRGPLLAALKLSSKGKNVYIPKINAYLSVYDYTQIFPWSISVLPYLFEPLEEKLKDYTEWKGQGHMYFYLFEREKLIGGAAGSVRGKNLIIESLFVESAHQRKGHGTRLLFSIEMLAKKIGCAYVSVGSAKNVANFYSFYGFDVIEKKKEYFVMRKRVG